MRVVIAGGHGKVALQLAELLLQAGHVPVGLIRKAEESAELTRRGMVPAVVDLEHAELDDVVAVLHGADAAVFAAGSGPGSPVERSLTMDRDGAILFADAAVAAGVRRFVMLSGAGADSFERGSNDAFQIYLKAKADADGAVRERDLDWVIVRPDALNDTEGSRTFEAATTVERHGIARADVAFALFDLATGTDPGRLQFELTTGRRPLREALESVHVARERNDR